MTHGWAVHAIAPDFQVWATRPRPPLPTALEKEIDRLWEAAQARTGGTLFNGQVFSADVITPHLICGHWSEYRRVVAQMARPDLYALLGIRSLAVGGVVVGHAAGAPFVVFGRRPARAVYQPGEWQLPPAGSVDATAARAEGRVDVIATLIAELHEELGLPPAAVRNPRPLCIVEHAAGGVGSHVLDLGIALTTDLSPEDIRARHAAGGDGEYGALEFIRAAELPGFLAREASAMNGQAAIFLRLAGVLAE